MAEDYGIGRTLKPTKLNVSAPDESRLYPRTKPDVYGQTNTPDHDHSQLGASSNESARLHSRSDVDSDQRALHHTLGTGRNQSSPGNHQHDGLTSKKIGLMEANPSFNPALPENDVTNPKFRPAWTCATSGASIRELLHKFIEFRDI